MRNINKRIEWIDMAKGYGMLLVIWAHLIDEGTHNWIYTFHMPLFFFLSGYVFSEKYNFITFVKRKCKAIVVPYFLLGIPMVMFELLKMWIKGTFSWSICLEYIELFLKQERLWTLWFIACLFWVNIIFYIMVKWIRYEVFIVLLSLIGMIVGLTYYRNGGMALPWNIDVCPMAMPFFCVGYFYKLHGKRIDKLLERNLVAAVTFIAGLVINFVFGALTWRVSGCGLEMFESRYGYPLFTYIAAFAGVLCVVVLAKQWTIVPIRYIGENSLLYYAWHQTIMIPIASKVLEKIGIGLVAGASFWQIVGYKLECMIIILGLTTICNEVFRWLRNYKKIGN